ncbi:MAG: 3-keto-disaccharide hydrolase, partial [Bryobacteraceae bacterium]
SGVRAPVIREKDDGSWRASKAVELFNGRDLTGWKVRVAGRPMAWKVEDALLKNVPPATDIISEANFWNFRLQAEYRLSKGSNSGIGLRGRYEVQIYEDHGRTPDGHTNGAIYSRIVPSANASRPAGEWQTFDITLIGRTVTVALNGAKIIDRQEVEGLTAIASDPNEAEPGPFILQGDHGPVEFRKFTVTPLVK